MPTRRPAFRHLARTLIALGLFATTTACGVRESTSAPRTKNDALPTPSLVNPNFVAGGGGWTGQDFPLKGGCALRTMRTDRPSLGTWLANTLAFGSRVSTVSQNVVIPAPSIANFSVVVSIPATSPTGWFNITAQDGDQSSTTGKKTVQRPGASTSYSVQVTTTKPNETVTISLTGAAGDNFRGCYGPRFTNMSLTLAPIPAPTTTTSSTTTTSTSTSTTTTIPFDQLTTCDVSVRVLWWDGEAPWVRVTACAPMDVIGVKYWAIDTISSYSGAAIPAGATSMDFKNLDDLRPQPEIDFDPNWARPTLGWQPDAIDIEIQLTNGTYLKRTRFDLSLDGQRKNVDFNR